MEHLSIAIGWLHWRRFEGRQLALKMALFTVYC
jgi:hypothetical protein